MSRIGLDIGGTKMVAILAERDGSRTAVVRRKTPQGGDPDELMAAIGTALAELAPGRECPEAEALGVGIAAYVDQSRGHVHYGPNLGLEDFPLGNLLHAKTGMPVFVENDVNCGILGEAGFGAVKGTRDAVCLLVGTGLGSGIISGGRLIRGARGVGAEAGHMIFQPGGRRCACGKRGCFEAYAGGRAIEERIEEACRSHSESQLCREEARNLSAIRKCLVAGDATARRIWDDAILALRVLVSNLVTLFDPATVLLGGRVIEELPEINEEIREYLVSQSMRGILYGIQLKKAALGDLGVALGAIRLPEEADV